MFDINRKPKTPTGEKCKYCEGNPILKQYLCCYYAEKTAVCHPILQDVLYETEDTVECCDENCPILHPNLLTGEGRLVIKHDN